MRIKRLTTLCGDRLDEFLRLCHKAGAAALWLPREERFDMLLLDAPSLEIPDLLTKTERKPS